MLDYRKEKNENLNIRTEPTIWMKHMVQVQFVLSIHEKVYFGREEMVHRFRASLITNCIIASTARFQFVLDHI